MPCPHPQRRQRARRTTPRSDISRRSALDRRSEHLGTPRAELFAQLEVLVVEHCPAEVGQLADEREVLNVRRDDDRERAGRVSMFSGLAVTGAAVREREEGLDAVDRVRVMFDDGLAVVELVQEPALGCSRTSRDVHREEMIAVTEQVSDDVAGELVDRAVEVKVSTVRKESRVIPGIEVSRRVESRRVLGTVKGRVDAQQVIIGIDASSADAVNRAVVLRLFDQSGFGTRVVIESCDESMRG